MRAVVQIIGNYNDVDEQTVKFESQLLLFFIGNSIPIKVGGEQDYDFLLLFSMSVSFLKRAMLFAQLLNGSLKTFEDVRTTSVFLCVIKVHILDCVKYLGPVLVDVDQTDDLVDIPGKLENAY